MNYTHFVKRNSIYLNGLATFIIRLKCNIVGIYSGLVTYTKVAC